MSVIDREYGRGFQLRAQAAVWIVAGQLALRGHVPMFPGLDVGFDIMLGNGLRIQVKSATLRIQSGVNYPDGAYSFALRRGAWDSNDKRYKRSSLRPYSEVADFFVLWGMDENRFFILPTKGCKKAIWFSRRGSISKSNNRKTFDVVTAKRLAEFEDRWDLLDVDSSVDAIVSSGSEVVAMVKEK